MGPTFSGCSLDLSGLKTQLCLLPQTFEVVDGHDLGSFDFFLLLGMDDLFDVRFFLVRDKFWEY